jgi:hypothetical protein
VSGSIALQQRDRLGGSRQQHCTYTHVSCAAWQRAAAGLAKQRQAAAPHVHTCLLHSLQLDSVVKCHMQAHHGATPQLCMFKMCPLFLFLIHVDILFI